MRKEKPIRLTLEPWPDPKLGRRYKGRVRSINENKKCICVTVENMDKTMAGRLHRIELPKCLHPGNQTSHFASAAGLDVDEFGEAIDLRAGIGATVSMLFLPVGDGYEIEFEKTRGDGRTEHNRGNSSENGAPPEADEARWER